MTPHEAQLLALGAAFGAIALALVQAGWRGPRRFWRTVGRWLVRVTERT